MENSLPLHRTFVSSLGKIRKFHSVMSSCLRELCDEYGGLEGGGKRFCVSRVALSVMGMPKLGYLVDIIEDCAILVGHDIVSGLNGIILETEACARPPPNVMEQCQEALSCSYYLFQRFALKFKGLVGEDATFLWRGFSPCICRGYYSIWYTGTSEARWPSCLKPPDKIPSETTPSKFRNACHVYAYQILEMWLTCIKLLEDEDDLIGSKLATDVQKCAMEVPTQVEKVFNHLSSVFGHWNEYFLYLSRWVFNTADYTSPLKGGSDLVRRVFDKEIDNHHEEKLLILQFCCHHLQKLANGDLPPKHNYSTGGVDSTGS